MLFMIIETFRNQDAVAIYRRVRERGKMIPEGLEFVDSWVSADLGRCFQLMRCEEVALLQRWIAQWTDLVEFEVIPVIPGKETSASLQELL